MLKFDVGQEVKISVGATCGIPSADAGSPVGFAGIMSQKGLSFQDIFVVKAEPKYGIYAVGKKNGGDGQWIVVDGRWLKPYVQGWEYDTVKTGDHVTIMWNACAGNPLLKSNRPEVFSKFLSDAGDSFDDTFRVVYESNMFGDVMVYNLSGDFGWMVHESFLRKVEGSDSNVVSYTRNQIYESGRFVGIDDDKVCRMIELMDKLKD